MLNEGTNQSCSLIFEMELLTQSSTRLFNPNPLDPATVSMFVARFALIHEKGQAFRVKLLVGKLKRNLDLARLALLLLTDWLSSSPCLALGLVWSTIYVTCPSVVSVNLKFQNNSSTTQLCI